MGRQDEFAQGRYYYKVSDPSPTGFRGPGNTSVVAYTSDDDTPVGSLKIQSGVNNINRQVNREKKLQKTKSIDERLSSAGSSHESEPGQIPGQMRFVGGVFGGAKPYAAPNGDVVDYIGWLHVDQGHERALGGMLGVGITAHGEIPHADSELSSHGSRIAKTSARRYGIKGHPHNPDMEPSFEQERSATDEISQHDASRLEKNGKPPRIVTHQEAKAQEKLVKANTPKAKAKRRKAEKERIARGKAQNVQLELDI